MPVETLKKSMNTTPPSILFPIGAGVVAYFIGEKSLWAAAAAEGESQPSPRESTPAKRSLLPPDPLPKTAKKAKKDPKPATTKICKRAGPPAFVPPRRTGGDGAVDVAQRLEDARNPPALA